jgi:hypothetical protein
MAILVPGIGERRLIEDEGRHGEHKRNQHNMHDHPSPHDGHLVVRNLGEI